MRLAAIPPRPPFRSLVLAGYIRLVVTPVLTEAEAAVIASEHLCPCGQVNLYC